MRNLTVCQASLLTTDQAKMPDWKKDGRRVPRLNPRKAKARRGMPGPLLFQANGVNQLVGSMRRAATQPGGGAEKAPTTGL